MNLLLALARPTGEAACILSCSDGDLGDGCDGCALLVAFVKDFVFGIVSCSLLLVVAEDRVVNRRCAVRWHLLSCAEVTDHFTAAEVSEDFLPNA